jgi:hypothetical protein
MPLNTDLNIAPFFDDYNSNNQYYRILFRPGVALQARELTQTQSILQNQIEQFGNWAFQNGDIVLGCGITDLPILPFARMADSNTLMTSLVNTTVVSATSNLSARVMVANNGLAANYPNTNVIYFQYLNTGNNGATTFSNNETLWFFTNPTSAPNLALANVIINTYANVTAGQISVGNAHGIAVANGVIFINGAFVNVLNPTFGIVNTYGTYASNNVVGFQLIEQIVDETLDPSLNDNALGYSNENAPGAWRMKLAPTLISLDPVTAANTAGFNPIATYNYGALTSKSTASSNVYSIVGDAIAQRIYDEAGNYVVNPFVVDTVTNLTGNSVVATLNANSVLGRIGPGVGYSQGERVELQKTAYIQMRRGVDTASFNAQQITFSYGNYFTVNEFAGFFPTANAQTVYLYDSPQQAVTSRAYSSISSANGNLIGTATVRNVSYNSGIPGSNSAVYYIHVYNIKMSNNFQVNQIKSIVANTYSPNGYADVISTGLKGTSVKEQLYTFGQPGMKNLRNASNNVNTEYVYRTAASGTLSGGNVTITVTSSAPGGTDILPYGIGQLAASDAASFNLIITANATTSSLGGTVSVITGVQVDGPYGGSPVSGTSTSFLTDFTTGDIITVGGVNRTVTYIANSSFMLVDSGFAVNNAAANYTKTIPAGKVVPLSYISGLPSGYVNVTNSTSFTISTNYTNLTTSPSVRVVYDVLRTSAIPATKNINKNVYVTLNLANNAGGPNGPWCLGFSDIQNITGIWGTSNGAYTTAGANLMSSFTFDTGQKDTHYGLGYLYPSAGFSSTSYPNLLVQLDYFTTNTSPGVGFYTVESYPIDDANTANTTAIQTKDISLYVDTAGNKIWLRDYVDFRTPCVSTANNTGYTDTTNATAVTTAISYATLNPVNTVTFPTYNLNSPSYSRNMQSDFTIYLPRVDLVTITPDNVIKVIEGQSKLSPQTPLFPTNSMAVSTIKIPPYPSLSSDQLDADQAVNARSKNLIRDTSTAITSTLVTNRRYSMADIGKLDTRISNLEYYTQLNLLQQQASNLTVTNQNGLNRFKNGIFVDSFNDFTGSDVSNPEYNIAIDSKKGQARPKFILEHFHANFNNSTSSNVQKTGRAITLPYVSIPFITQPYATKYRSSAHVSAHWTGSLTLMPNYNDNVDQNTTASVNMTINNATPWLQFANSPFGSIWGAWQTSVNSVSTSVVTGQVNTYNVELGYQYTSGTSQQALDAAIAQYQAAGYTIGGTSLTFTAQHGGIGSNASITQVS